MTAVETVRDQVRVLIRTAMDTSPSADPSVVASTVIDNLSARQMKEALALCLPNYVRVEMSKYGWKVRDAGRGPMTSADRIRSWYAQQLGVSLFVGDAWKFLKDCTAEDLHTAASDRYKKATETQREGDRWTKLALFMEENDRDTVSSVREDELKSLMEGS